MNTKTNLLSNKNFKLLTLVVLTVSFASSFFTACKPKNDILPEENDEEVITTVKLIFEPIGEGETLTYQFKDEDGPGGAVPIQDDITLSANKEYNVSLEFWNESISPAVNITLEVLEEANEHRIYYQPSLESNITVGVLDTDDNGISLGLKSKWTTTDAAIGTVKITLRHYSGNPPNKANDDTVDNPKSSTDVAVAFNTKVE